jgi:hypothetical protein
MLVPRGAQTDIQVGMWKGCKYMRGIHYWRAQMDGEAKTQKESERVKDTHPAADRWTSQDMERN